MIIQNLIIGNDKFGEKLRCGDICEYEINKMQRKGLIVYDEDTYSFAFEQIENEFPIALMSAVDFGTIEKSINMDRITRNYPNYDKWKEIYNNNLWIIK